jgi:hypothetical protein
LSVNSYENIIVFGENLKLGINSKRNDFIIMHLGVGPVDFSFKEKELLFYIFASLRF